MELIIADSNIFVYLFNSDLFIKVLDSSLLDIRITTGVKDELLKGRRIPIEYPNLSANISNTINNPNSNSRLKVIDFNHYEFQNEEILNVYFNLENQGELDKGELESIPIALDLGAIFVTNDIDAYEEANHINSGLAIKFKDFCNQLRILNIISHDDLKTAKKYFY